MRLGTQLRIATVVVAVTGFMAFITLALFACHLCTSARLHVARDYALAVGVSLLIYVAFALIIGFTMSTCEFLNDLRESSETVPSARNSVIRAEVPWV